MSRHEQPLRTLLQTYHELNASTIDELTEEPTALEFMRYVARNRPFVVRQGAAQWKARQRWDAEYLLDRMGAARVNVAITPSGNADSIVMHHGDMLYVEPHERHVPFDEVLDYIRSQEQGSSRGTSSTTTAPPVIYAQTQNDNLRDEYELLFKDVPKTIPFARIALQQPDPDAINFWLGNSRSVSALHRDNYENIFVQIRGKKRFLLLPPIAVACVEERQCKRARYMADEPNDDLHHLRLDPVVDQPVITTPIPTWDPDAVPAPPGSLAALVEPNIVVLEEGDMMYLPALWYHKVSQVAGPQGFCCSVNYWYDMDHAGSFWATHAFVRDVTMSPA